MRLAVVDDETIVQKRLQSALAKEGYQVSTFGSGEEFLKALTIPPFDLVFLDVILPGINGMDTLKRIKAEAPDTEVIIMTGRASLDAAIEAVKLGAFHYIAKPFKLEEVRHLAARALEHKGLLVENRDLNARLVPLEGWGEEIGVSQGIKEVFAVIRKVAPLSCHVLIQGESGTGKELVARLIHRESPRRDKPFVAFNCAGFTDELIASELFGYERGAFTGATATKIGILETAHQGTVFMDEIGDMPAGMQAKLLRVIQEQQVLRVGGNKPIQLDLRFITASNKDMKREVQEGRFREDLFSASTWCRSPFPASGTAKKISRPWCSISWPSTAASSPKGSRAWTPRPGTRSWLTPIRGTSGNWRTSSSGPWPWRKAAP